MSGWTVRDGVYADGRVDGRKLAAILGVPHGTVKRWLSLEDLPCERRGHRVRIDVQKAKAWIAKRHPNSVSFHRADAVVYFVRRHADGAIKIGFTSDIERRLREIRRDCKSVVTLLACVPGAKREELSIQNRFATHVVKDEWFRPSKALLAFIAGLGKAVAA